MESETTTSKYQKLAAEYSKLRVSASVLKKAVLEEQNKSSVLREVLRVKEASLRKSEQEVDSLGFRNKQLEKRVASLQDILDNELKKTNKNTRSKNSNENWIKDADVIAEELQKRIIENAQLSSLIDDKNMEIRQYQSKVSELDQEIQRYHSQQSELEIKLRKEIDHLTMKNAELEAASTIGSEDGLSVSTDIDNHTNFNSTTATTNCDDRVTFLEKELNHWRSQFELLKIDASRRNVKSNVGNKNSEDNQEENLREEKLTERITEIVDELFNDKCRAESKLMSHMTEYQHVQTHLVILKNRIKESEEKTQEDARKYRIIEDDLATTRLNYEEQISVLTEQVISLSEQLANSK